MSNSIKELIGKKIKYPLVIADNGELGKLIHVREYTNKELKNVFVKAGFNNINVKDFWFGLRGNVNVGVSKPLIKSLSQYLFAKGTKK